MAVYEFSSFIINYNALNTNYIRDGKFHLKTNLIIERDFTVSAAHGQIPIFYANSFPLPANILVKKINVRTKYHMVWNPTGIQKLYISFPGNSNPSIASANELIFGIRSDNYSDNTVYSNRTESNDIFPNSDYTYQTGFYLISESCFTTSRTYINDQDMRGINDISYNLNMYFSSAMKNYFTVYFAHVQTQYEFTQSCQAMCDLYYTNNLLAGATALPCSLYKSIDIEVIGDYFGDNKGD
jgi:hypothetical protein